MHIYRERTHRLFNARYSTEFLLSPDDLTDDEPVEFVEVTAGGSGSAAALYDAYLPFRPPPTRPSVADPVTFTRQTVTSPRPISPPPPIVQRSSAWAPLSSSAGSSTTLSRQRSIHRPSRSRTTDFTDFATRRRSIVRANAETSEAVRAEESADGTWRFAHPERPGSADPDPSSSNNRLGRRLSPLTAWSDPHLRIDVGAETPWSLSPTPDNRADSAESTTHQSSSQLWYSLLGRRSPSTTERSAAPIPRLRRGGVHAPETFPRYEQSPTDAATSQTEGRSGAAEDSSSSQLSAPGAGPSGRTQSSEMDALDEASRQLLTPRSISPAVEVFHM